LITKRILIALISIVLNAQGLVIGLKANQEYENLDRIIAIVEKDIITQKELEQETNQIINKLEKNGRKEQKKSDLIKNVLDRLIEKKLILQHAEAFGIKSDPKVLEQVIQNIAQDNGLSIEEMRKTIELEGIKFDDFRKDLEYQFILKQIKEREIYSKIIISDYEVETLLKKTSSQSSNEYRLSHILIKTTTSNYNKATERLNKTIDSLRVKLFSDVAKENSDGPLAMNGGDLGWKKLNELPEIFSNAILKMKVGDISTPIISENGIHLLKLIEVKGDIEEKFLSDQYNISQILIKANEINTEEDIKRNLENIKNQISDSLAFSDAASKYSEDSSAANGGKVGWLDINDMLPEYRKAIISTKIGVVSGPYKTELGWLLFLTTDKRSQDITQDKIKQRARIQLLQSKAEVKYQDWFKALKAKANIQILLNE
jgi:peptidyl-prolyl cis-trans isomerase SurA